LRQIDEDSMCLVMREEELILTELNLIELILVKSELNKIDLCLDTYVYLKSDFI
jgi:hypothetical protein